MAEVQKSNNLSNDVALTQVIAATTAAGSLTVGASPFAGTLKSVTAVSTGIEATTLLVAVDGTDTNGGVDTPGPAGAGQANAVSVALGADNTGVSVLAGSLITITTDAAAVGDIAITYVIG